MGVLTCDCCANPITKKIGKYKACSMCAPVEPEELIAEGYVRDKDRSRKARYRELVYKCTSPLCNKNLTFESSIFVLEWIED